MRYPRAFSQATGLPLRFHWSAPILVLLVIVSWMPKGVLTTQNAIDMVAALLALSVALLFHEWSHAAAAIMADARPIDVHVHAFGASVRFAGVPQHKMGAVVAAGPVMNLTISVLAAFVAGIAVLSGARPGTHVWDLIFRFAWQMMLINAWLGAFNLIPIWPMDGGALLRLGTKARVARGSAWTMVAVTAFAVVAAIYLSGWLLIAILLFALVCAPMVGWHGVLGPVREERNEWGDVVE